MIQTKEEIEEERKIRHRASKMTVEEQETHLKNIVPFEFITSRDVRKKAC